MSMYPVLLADKVLRGTEKLTGTEIASMTMIGLAVVFFFLLILVLFLTVSGGIFKKTGGVQKRSAPPQAPVKAAPKKEAAPAKPAPKPKAAPAPVLTAAPEEDDSEVIAVIMAAIAAMGAAEGKQYRLRSVRRVNGGGSGRSAWAQAGINEVTRPF